MRRTRSRVALAALVATLVTLALAVTARGDSFEVSEQGFIARWRELTLEGGGFRAVCSIQVRGRFFARTMGKAANQAVGDIEEARKTSCSSLDIAFLNGVERLPGEETPLPSTLPWTIGFKDWEGVLPNIRRVQLMFVEVGLTVGTVFGVDCLYESTGMFPLLVNFSINSGQVVAATIEPTVIPFRRGGILCPEFGRASGTGEVTNAAGTASISVRLI